jgi:hypothetical protein
VSEFLSPAEVKDLAGCAARDAQAEKLAALGVPFKRDGSRLIVSREIARRWTCGEVFRASSGPRLDLVR